MSLETTAIIVSSFIVIIIALALFASRSLLLWRNYDWRDVAANFAVAAGNVAAGSLTYQYISSIYDWTYKYKLFDIQWDIKTALLIFLLEDFCYYLFHRASHSIRLWWTAHSVHHSSKFFNLSVALRQPWTGRLAGQFIFWAPLSLVGFSTEWIYWQGCISLGYQFWIHLEGVGKLPRPIEWAFNTPTHHRVHHAMNSCYLDKNFGGILIIWDRMFGTFASESEEEALIYGATNPVNSFNPITIALRESVDMLKELTIPGPLRRKAGILFGPP